MLRRDVIGRSRTDASAGAEVGNFEHQLPRRQLWQKRV